MTRRCVRSGTSALAAAQTDSSEAVRAVGIAERCALPVQLVFDLGAGPLAASQNASGGACRARRFVGGGRTQLDTMFRTGGGSGAGVVAVLVAAAGRTVDVLRVRVRRARRRVVGQGVEIDLTVDGGVVDRAVAVRRFVAGAGRGGRVVRDGRPAAGVGLAFRAALGDGTALLGAQLGATGGRFADRAGGRSGQVGGFGVRLVGAEMLDAGRRSGVAVMPGRGCGHGVRSLNGAGIIHAGPFRRRRGGRRGARHGGQRGRRALPTGGGRRRGAGGRHGTVVGGVGAAAGGAGVVTLRARRAVGRRGGVVRWTWGGGRRDGLRVGGCGRRDGAR